MIHEYPYTDSTEYNLDWIIDKIKELEERVDEIENAMEE